MATGFKCMVCGTWHDQLMLDIGYQLPDCVWALPEEERAARAKFNSDLCSFEGRYFLRGILYVPIPEISEQFGWGVWAEVDEAVFDRYLELFDRDGSQETPGHGELANKLPGYPESLGRKLTVHFGPPDKRPCLVMADKETGTLAEDQRQGISYARYHGLVECFTGKSW
ncbi:hypothetical protein SDC9_18902 [bioreactor metagenome]|uniref:DUF2199 domain-containing protein n=1 Tax=bioreactor metagenome TaxID=1076179 RepID=A0A644U2G9_9ZZZZ